MDRLLKGIEMICFDVDGTLYTDVDRVWEAVKPLAVELVAEQTGVARGKVESDFNGIYMMTGSSTKVLENFGIVAVDFFREELGKMDLTKVIDRNERVIEAIRNLKSKGFRLSVLSNGGLGAVKKKLMVIGLNVEDFEFVLASDELGVSKPNKGAFGAVVERSAREGKKLRHDQILYVGDREEIDVVGAKNVGMKAVLVGGRSELADENFKDLSELVRFI